MFWGRPFLLMSILLTGMLGYISKNTKKKILFHTNYRYANAFLPLSFRYLDAITTRGPELADMYQRFHPEEMTVVEREPSEETSLIGLYGSLNSSSDRLRESPVIDHYTPTMVS